MKKLDLQGNARHVAALTIMSIRHDCKGWFATIHKLEQRTAIDAAMARDIDLFEDARELASISFAAFRARRLEAKS